MSYGNRNSITVTWLVFSLFLILVAVWLAWSELRKAEPQATQEYESSAYARRAQTRIDRICVELTGVDLLHCEYEVEQPERENYRAQKDLRAQWYMAIWAGIMTFFTFGTLIVTGLGVFFVQQTLVQSNKTNKAALKAAKAANRTNKIMRQEQRPWVVSEGVKCTWITNAHSEDGQELGAAVLLEKRWSNLGNSPAMRCSIYTEVRKIPVESITPRFESEARESDGIIGPNAKVFGAKKVLYGTEYEDFVLGKIDIMMFSRIDYFDPFDRTKSYFSEGTIRIRRIGGGDGQNVVEQEYAGPQNKIT